jgi:transcriptional regulator
MAVDRLDLLQGTLDLLVLKTLTWGPMHGYGISSMINQRSDGDITVVDAALYKALHRLERDDYVASTWGLSENNRRAKFYKLTALGRKQLVKESDNWSRLAEAIARVMQTA